MKGVDGHSFSDYIDGFHFLNRASSPRGKLASGVSTSSYPFVQGGAWPIRVGRTTHMIPLQSQYGFGANG